MVHIGQAAVVQIVAHSQAQSVHFCNQDTVVHNQTDCHVSLKSVSLMTVSSDL